MLNSKGEKINLGKYHHATFNGRRTLHLFSLRGFFFGLAAEKLGHKGFRTGRAPKAPLATPSGAATSSGDGEVQARATLKQTGAEPLGIETQNQLDRAAVTFGDITNLHKATIAVSVLSHTAEWHSEQAKELRSAGATIEYELRMMKGAIHYHSRLTMFQALHTKRYESCGIETVWRQSGDLFENHPRVLYSDDMCCKLWDMCVAAVLQHSARNLVFTNGLPRRQTLLCDPDRTIAEGFIQEFRQDCLNYDALSALDYEWAQVLKDRSVFVKRCVQQLRGCLDIEAWALTPRLRCMPRGMSVGFPHCTHQDPKYFVPGASRIPHG